MKHGMIAAIIALLILAPGALIAAGVVAHLTDSGPVVATVPVDPDSFPLIIDERTGRAFIGSFHSTRVRVLDIATGRLLRTVTLAQIPVFDPFNAGGTHLTSGQPGYVFILGQPGNSGPASYTVSALDAWSGRLVRTLPLPATDDTAWLAVDPRTQRVFALSTAFPIMHLSVFDARRLRLLRASSIGHALAASAWGFSLSPLAVDMRSGRVFVSHAENTSVGMFDARDGRLLRTIRLQPARSLFNHSWSVDGLALDETLGRVYVLDTMNSIVHTLDAASGRVLGSASVGSGRADAILPLVDEHTDRLFIAPRPVATLLDAGSGRLLSTSSAREFPLVMDERSGHMFAPTRNDNTVDMLDGLTARVLRTVTVGGFPTSMAADATGGQVLVLNASPYDANRQPIANGSISVLDGRSGALQRTIPVGLAPEIVTVDARARRALVFNEAGGTVSTPSPWTWLPAWLRRWLPFRPQAPSRVLAGSVTVLDTSRL